FDSRITSTGATLNLITADQNAFLLTPNGPGQWASTDAPFLRGAVITQVAGEFSFQIRFKDGTVHRYERIIGFANTAGLSAITVLTNEYDTAGRVVRQTQADGGVWQFTYVAEGTTVTQTTVTDPRGNATVHRFDGQGFPLATTDALGQTTTFVYTPGSNLLALTTDPLGRTTRVTYDAQVN